MPNPQNFRLNSDYPMDKIVYYKTGTFSPHNGDVQWNHNLSFTPLLFGVFSATSDFSESYSFNSPINESGTVANFNVNSINLLSNSTVGYLFMPNSTTGLPNTYYYRIYGFSDENSNISANGTSSNAQSYVINSDYSYYKLYMADHVVYNGSSSVTINHNLGYKPYVLVWGKSVMFQAYPPITQVIKSVDDASQKGVFVTDNTIVINCLGNTYINEFSEIWYRIYCDAA